MKRLERILLPAYLIFMGIFLIGCVKEKKENMSLPQMCDVLRVVESVPLYDTVTETPSERTSDYGLVNARYFHNAPYKGAWAAANDVADVDKYYICTDPPEYNSNSRYALYGLTDSGMVLHKTNYYYGDFTWLGEHYTPSFGYTVYNGKAEVMYNPYNTEEHRNLEFQKLLYDSETGRVEGFLSLFRKTKGGDSCRYPVIVNFETGEIKDFLKLASPVVAQEAIKENVSLIAIGAKYCFVRIGKDSYYFIGYETQKIQKVNNIPTEVDDWLQEIVRRRPDPVLSIIEEVDNAFICVGRRDNNELFYLLCDMGRGYIAKLDNLVDEPIVAVTLSNDAVLCRGKNTVWRISRETLKAERLLHNVKILYGFETKAPRTIYYAIPKSPELLIYKKEDNVYGVYDYIENRELVLSKEEMKTDWNQRSFLVSPNGRKVLIYCLNDKNTFQFQVLDCDRKTLLIMDRDNANSLKENRIGWYSDDKIVISSENVRDCYLYCVN